MTEREALKRVRLLVDQAQGRTPGADPGQGGYAFNYQWSHFVTALDEILKDVKETES